MAWTPRGARATTHGGVGGSSLASQPTAPRSGSPSAPGRGRWRPRVLVGPGAGLPGDGSPAPRVPPEGPCARGPRRRRCRAKPRGISRPCGWPPPVRTPCVPARAASRATGPRIRRPPRSGRRTARPGWPVTPSRPSTGGTGAPPQRVDLRHRAPQNPPDPERRDACHLPRAGLPTRRGGRQDLTTDSRSREGRRTPRRGTLSRRVAGD